MKKPCPNCNEYEFGFWELFKLSVIFYSKDCNNCGLKVYVRAYISYWVEIILFYSFLLGLAASLFVGTIHGATYYSIWKYFPFLLIFFLLVRMFEFWAFDLKIVKTKK